MIYDASKAMFLLQYKFKFEKHPGRVWVFQTISRVGFPDPKYDGSFTEVFRSWVDPYLCDSFTISQAYCVNWHGGEWILHEAWTYRVKARAWYAPETMAGARADWKTQKQTKPKTQPWGDTLGTRRVLKMPPEWEHGCLNRVAEFCWDPRLQTLTCHVFISIGIERKEYKEQSFAFQFEQAEGGAHWLKLN